MATTQDLVLLDSSPKSSPGDREAALVSNTTSRNVAKGSAIQINGHIANEVNSLNNW